jgi:gustatory receptor
LSFRIWLTAFMVIFLASAEHILFVANSAYNKYQSVKNCNWTIDEPVSYFLEHQFAFFFDTFRFNLPLGIFVETMNIFFTMGWNYMELFVMITSIGLVTRFRQINNRIDELKGKVNYEGVMEKKRII